MKTTAALAVAIMAAVQPAIDTKEVDLVSLDMGGHIERVTSEGGVTLEAVRLIDGNPRSSWTSAADGKFPVEIVFSFFGRQAALVQSVTIVPSRDVASHPKEVEVWTSTESAAAGFKKVAGFTAARDGVQSFPIPSVEARFVKLSILSNYGDPKRVSISKVKVIEGARPGYQPLLARNPDLAALAAGGVPEPWKSAAAARTAAPTAPSATPVLEGCSVARDATAPSGERPRHPESRTVLVVTREKNVYPPLTYKPREDMGPSESISERVDFRRIWPGDARPAVLADVEGIDTVVF
jgi:hypothetical protein